MMPMDAFKTAYKNSDIKQLRRYIKLPKLLSTKKFVTYTESSFTTNREVYDILVLIIFNQYDLTRVISDIIDRDNVDLLEDILSNNYDVELDEDLILKTQVNGRITMAKAIYEYIYDVEKDSYSVITNLMKKYKFVYNENENSIDSFILALRRNKCEHIEKTIPYINPGFWNSFAIRCICDYIIINRIYEINVVQKLLSCSQIDPGIADNYPLKAMINRRHYSIANELLKHPLVNIEYITADFCDYLIENNKLCVSEKILRLGDNNSIDIFKESIMKFIDNEFDCRTDIVYLAIKLKIINISELINYYPEEKSNIKKYLKNLEIDKSYVQSSYEYNLDPDQIFKEALDTDDIYLAKSIKNYPTSIPAHKLLFKLLLYNNSVADYIYNTILIKYDPTAILLHTQWSPMFKKIFNIIGHNPDIDYEYICIHNQGRNITNTILECIKSIYTDKEYKKFLHKMGL